MNLVKVTVKVNSHVLVLCPTLAEEKVCYRTGKGLLRGEKKAIVRPKLLVKNHKDPDLQLWSCEGCAEKFLLRVDLGDIK